MYYDSSGNECGVDIRDEDFHFDYLKGDISSSDDDMELEDPKETSEEGVVRSLFEQAANVIGSRLPFEAVELWAERLGKKMSDEVQLAVMKASFPTDKGLVRRYAYLSRTRYDRIFDLVSQRRKRRFAVRDLIQIGEKVNKLRQHFRKIKLTDVELMSRKEWKQGFCLTGKIQRVKSRDTNEKEIVASVFFDRQRVTSMLCSEHTDCSWCPHVVSLTLYRMDNPDKVKYRLPVSDSVQRLSESEQKQFINMLLAHRPLEMLAFAQETLDELLTRKHSSKVASKGKDLQDVVNVPDLTAGGSVDAEGLWSVGDKEIRRFSRGFFRRKSLLSRSVLSNRYGYGFSSWVDVLQKSVDKNNDGAIAEKKATSYSSIRNAETTLQVITDLTKRGENSAIAVLNIVTEEWLEALAKRTCRKEERSTNSSQSSNGTCSITQKLSQIQPQLPQPVKNVEFLSATGSFCFPDKLAACWRRAALQSIIDGDDLLPLIRGKLTDLALKLDQIVSVALTNMEKKKHSSTSYSVQRDKALWDSLLEWNGFQHVADLLNPAVCNVFRSLSKNADSVSPSSVLPSISSGFEVLVTSTYIVLCLMDGGIDEGAARLARVCISAILAPMLSATSYKVDHCPKKDLHALQALSVIAQSHEEVSALLWRDSYGDLMKILNILFNAIQKEHWAWSSQYTWNLASWFAKKLSTSSSQNEIVDSVVNSVDFVAPPAVMLGLLCVVSATDVASSSQIEQAALAREKNRILSVMFQHISEMTDNVLHEISRLAPFLEQNISRLDAPSTALLFLHCVILLKSQPGGDSNNEAKRLLSATGAALRQQTMILVNLFDDASSVDFSCYETQCVASTFMALTTCKQSKEDLSFVVCCLTENVVETLQGQTATQADKTTTEPENKTGANESLVKCYISDTIRIVNGLSGTDISRLYLPYAYYECSSLSKRLLLLNSPISELLENDSDSTTSTQLKSLLPCVVTNSLNEMNQMKSTLTWQAAVELLLFLLQVNLEGKGLSSHQDAILELLKDASGQIGAVSFLQIAVSKCCNNVVATEQLFTSFLMEEEFQESLTRKEGSASFTTAPLKDIFIVYAVALSMGRSSDLYDVACNLKLVDAVITDVLADTGDLQQKLSHDFLFLLAQHSTGRATPAQQMQIGLAALRRWQQHCSLPSNLVKLTNILTDRYAYSLHEDNAILRCLHLVSFAVCIDNKLLAHPNTDLQTMECNRVGAVDDLLTLIRQDWIDPLIAAIILVEVCRISQICFKNASLEDDWLYEANLHIPLHQILSAQDKFMSSSDAQKMFHKLCTSIYVANVLALKCKTAIADFLVYFKQLAANSEDSAEKVDVKHGVLPNRNPCVRDFICLEFLCQVFPHDGFDFEALLINSENEPRGCRRGHGRYQFHEVVEKFKRMKAPRKYRNHGRYGLHRRYDVW